MDGFKIPPTPFWFLPSGYISTPDNGILYVAGSQSTVAYISQCKNNEAPVIKFFYVKKSIKAMDCDPDWSTTKFFATFDRSNIINVFDLDIGNVIRAHKAHVNSLEDNKTQIAAMCFTKNRQILSADTKLFVKYCVTSNTYVLFPNTALLKRYSINILKASPYDENIFAAGSTRGLIIIAKLTDCSILYTLRAHDTEITSLDWMLIDVSSTSTEELDLQVVPTSSNIQTNNVVEDNVIFDENQTPLTYTNNEINHSIVPLNHNNESSNGLDGVDATITEISTKERNIKNIIYLTSSSKEPFIWIWNTHTGVGVHKIEFKNTGKSVLPAVCIVLSWINKNTLITTSPNGDLNMWNINHDKNNKLICVNKKTVFLETAVFGICKGKQLNSDSPIIWTTSYKHQIVCTELNDTTKVIANYSTLSIRMYAIKSCPVDLNKIAIAGTNKRIQLLNYSNLQGNNIVLNSFTNKIQSIVLALAWHPTKENILAFSTEEGRVGVVDTNKSSIPLIMKPFTGKKVYQISWGFIQNKSDDELQCVLFACSDGKLVYFPENGEEKNTPVKICLDENITSVSAGKDLLATGTQQGVATIYTLNLEKVWSLKLSHKYISECSWSSINTSKLAISSLETEIKLFNCEYYKDNRIDSIGTLKGHTSGVTSIVWSNETEHKLVSTSFDCTVRVWNTENLECISTCRFMGHMYSAMFSPTNDNFVLCSGIAETVSIFDSTNQKEDQNKTNTKGIKDIKWAISLNSDKKKTKIEKASSNCNGSNELLPLVVTSENTEQLQNINMSADIPIENMSNKTILPLTGREFNKEVNLNFKDFLNNAEDGESCHQLLFSNRTDIKELLKRELEHHKQTNMASSIGNILIPQICYDLEDEITNNITSKTLTVQHLAVAPMISYNFWKKCCKAYALQNIEKGWTMLAIPYLLSCHEINEAIEELCAANCYREAWIIAKLNKEEADNIFDIISNKWINCLQGNGNLMGAALIATSVSKNDLAIEILSKNHESNKEYIELLKKKSIII